MSQEPITQIQKAEEKTLAEYLRSDKIIARFEALMNKREAAQYIQNVIILVESDEKEGEYNLRNCTFASITKACLRAASMKINVDPSNRQGWLVPRKKKTKDGREVFEATLQLHYAEIRNRAMRTGLYQVINVSPVYDGETVMEEPFSGLHVIRLKSGVEIMPGMKNGFIPVNERRGKVIGWMGYIKPWKGAEVTHYMSVDDIENYVSGYNPFYKRSFAWTGKGREVMEQKTVLLTMLREKADISGTQAAELREIVNGGGSINSDDEVIEGEAQPIEAKPKMSEQDLLSSLNPEWR